MMNITTFTDTNAALSQRIYKTFVNGGVINRKEYAESKASYIETPTFRELVVHQEHYTQMYWHLGFHLEHDRDSDYFYIKALSDDDSPQDEFDEASLKLMAILSLISKMALERGQALPTLSEPIQGITPADITSLNNDEQCIAILRSLKLKDAEDAIAFLRKRGFAFATGSKRYVLSKGALVMINAIIEKQKEHEVD